MNIFKQTKRKFLIRLMTALGFGSMAAFCISSCQSATSNSDKQPKQETAESASSEVPQPASDNNDTANLPTPELTENAAGSDPSPVPEPQMPVKKYGIPSQLPPDVLDHIDEIQVPPTPEANEEALKNQNDEQTDNLNPEYTEEDLWKKPYPGSSRPVKKYGVQPPPQPQPIVTKYGIRY